MKYKANASTGFVGIFTKTCIEIDLQDRIFRRFPSIQMFFHRRIHPALKHREFQTVPLDKSLEDTAKKTFYIRDLSRIPAKPNFPNTLYTNRQAQIALKTFSTLTPQREQTGSEATLLIQRLFLEGM
ncbi:hypothetical protein ERO13_D02G156550v2 [Gossypium hirsutum]|uniref:Uncharacterized protein n=4 Tax=Gossypium TaxID=3633 RepID=A0A5J5SEQ1_GOSBA|nr:hypothetical protein ES319_D02G180500v1 [Gossypium barbadense]KAG4159108.1 hypothetical protein ERO13_D02G156550v2 [Gossypium hirsutum]TYG80164.1 hypothetical protein ES288_D02G194500v1 [Gossypium darwinii]TYH84460.1 hypothetical protein ES332_D02G197700v1 [Gossypium tomentosum]TYI94182.1 hypothetical protein E1A91_D02G184600v1 [Gossypium mustelinum]